jgi:hypothetical protein
MTKLLARLLCVLAFGYISTSVFLDMDNTIGFFPTP